MNDEVRDDVPVPLADSIDRFVRGTGHVICWAYAALIAVIILQVTLRYGFKDGLVVLEELEWHLYAVGVMFGVAYAQTLDSHVRVDIFHLRFSTTTKRVWEIIGILVFVLPFIAIVLFNSLDFVADAWRIGERSDAPMGLPWRWLIKSAIPASFGLLGVAVLSRLWRETYLLFRGTRR